MRPGDPLSPSRQSHRPSAFTGDRIRVVIVGGGCAALTAAFELTRPEHRGRYEVTVYQMGWRLGGKGASGRGVADRIEEHGLHLWMGFYENAFRIMRECYAELADDPAPRRFRHWRQAFSPAPDVAVTDALGGGEWDFWVTRFPPSPGEPGDPPGQGSPFSIRRYLLQSARLVAELVRSANAMESEDCGEPRPPWVEGTAPPPTSVDLAVDALLRYGQLATATALFQASDLLLHLIERWLPTPLQDAATPLLRITALVSEAAHRQLLRLTDTDGEARRVWQVIDLIVASMRGCIVEGLIVHPQGFDAINDYDWCEWLALHGASDESLRSGFMRAIYGLVFAFEDGDVRRPRLAAGVAMRGAVRMFFTYRGALFWRMNGGMGDVVFAPLYAVLKRRGVHFRFFHRLRNVRLAPERRGETAYVEALQFDVQARVKEGEYQPLRTIKDMPAWLSRPDYVQLEDGDRIEGEARAFESQWEERREGELTLRVSRDFDFVVLGVSLGVLPLVASELIERKAKWRRMIRHVKTVPTQAFQLWLREDVRQLGWAHPPISLSGFVEPFDTWADMGHLIPEENWSEPVRSIAYFCSVLPDPGTFNGEGPVAFMQQQHERVRQNAIHFLENHVGVLWPRAMDSKDEFRWDLIAREPKTVPLSAPDSHRFATQYWRANVDPSDRYVLSVPGSSAHRISPLDMSFDNLTIAGDWTATGLDSGCIESAVISGRLAAHALSHSPPLADIIGYDHP